MVVVVAVSHTVSVQCGTLDNGVPMLDMLLLHLFLPMLEIVLLHLCLCVVSREQSSPQASLRDS